MRSIRVRLEESGSRSMLVSSICLSCAIASIFYLAPASLFLVNSKEVVVSLREVIAASVFLQVGVLASGLAASIFGGHAVRVRIATACAAVALLIYLQGNLLVWDYGRFDGSEIDWKRHQLAGLFELALWTGVLVASQVFAARLVGLAPRIALLAVFLQLSSVGLEIAAGRSWDPARPTEVDANLLHFSREQNVLVLVLDGFQSHAFDAILEASPELADDLKGFVYFQDTLSVFPTTLMSVPAMLSGAIYDNGVPTEAFFHKALSETSLPDALASRGYASSVVTRAVYCEYFVESSCTGQLQVSSEDEQRRRLRDVVKIWDVTLFRHLPHALKQQVYRNRDWLLNRTLLGVAEEHDGALHAASDDPSKESPTDRQQASGLLWSMLARNADAESESRTFKFLHFWSSHTPYVVDESCELLAVERADPPGGLLPNLHQSRCTLDAALTLTRVLGDIGVLDQTLLVITADHGSPEPYTTLPGFDEIDVNRAFPLLLVKPIGSSADFATLRQPASLADLPRTLAVQLGLSHTYPGQSIFELTDSRERHYFHYRWKHQYWGANYLPPIQEYRVRGNGRDPAAWSKARLLMPAVR